MSVFTRRSLTLLVTGLLGFGAAVGGSPLPRGVEDQNEALLVFNERISQYAALHRQLEGPLPSPKTAHSQRSLMVVRAFLGSAMKTARPNARQGDIFTPSVAQYFRRIIAETLEDRDGAALLRDLNAGHRIMHGFHPRVYDPYPDWASHEMPVVLLRRLPSLPEDIEYRLLDHDLVLWDIHADLIVDFLPDAITPPPGES